MADIKKARKLFKESGLAFPKIPKELAQRLKQQREWLFSTRKINIPPYNLDYYIHELDIRDVKDYAIVAHSGHGVNSYAIQYYLLYGDLRMLLHLGWGGVYMDAKETTAKICQCFSLADEIIAALKNRERFKAGDRITIVGSDFYGSYWSVSRRNRQIKKIHYKTPEAMLAKALNWLGAPG
ncbi:MAG: hypothetical protein FJ240_13545 [Nitrospira sp.]|nr:hypothetical protein [Nitrospira sp.]